MMPTVLTHPLAPPKQTAPAVTPKYLVRSDGMVAVYTTALAKLPNFTPVETLPAAHVLASELAARRDAAALVARQQHQARMEAGELALRERVAAGVTQVGGVAVAGHAAVVGASASARVSGAASAAVAVLDISSADKAGLREFFAQHQVKADLRRPVEELRALAHEVARKEHAPGAA